MNYSWLLHSSQEFLVRVGWGIAFPPECKGKDNHIHLLLDIHQDNKISALLGSIKLATSRILRKEFEQELRQHFKNWSKGLWGDQLYICSACGAPLKVFE